jgi:hypothetical protein
MEREPLPDELRRFVLRSVPSVPFVEGLLIVRDAAPQPITIEALARRLYVSESEAAQVIDLLRTAQIVRKADDGGNLYAPDPDLIPVLDLLARYYRSNLVEMTALIHSRTGRMAQQFADAFKIRKD